MLKILLIIWVINLVIRVFAKNYISNDIQANIKYQIGIYSFSSVLYTICSLIHYILGLVLVIMIICEIF